MRYLVFYPDVTCATAQAAVRGLPAYGGGGKVCFEVFSVGFVAIITTDTNEAADAFITTLDSALPGAPRQISVAGTDDRGPAGGASVLCASPRSECGRRPESTACVLIVDGDEVCLRGTEHLLSRGLPDTCIHVSPSSEDALAMMEAQRFAAVLCEAAIAGLNGQGLIRMASKASPRTPVIVMTAGDYPPVPAPEDLPFGYLRKPIGQVACWKTVERALEYYALTRAVAPADGFTEAQNVLDKDLGRLVEESRAASRAQWPPPPSEGR